MKKHKLLTVLTILSITFVISIVKIVYANDTINSKNLIAEIKDEKIYLYYDKKTATGMLEGFYLKSGDNVKYFDWESIDKLGFYPTIKIIQDDYIAVITTRGEGSGLDIEELHLINKNTFKEISYKSPLDVVEANVLSEIQAPNVMIKIDNNTWSSTYPTVKKQSHFFDTISYESMVTYNIYDTYFTVSLQAQVTPALFIGEFKLTYLWNEKKLKFIPSTINFNFYDNEIE